MTDEVSAAEPAAAAAGPIRQGRIRRGLNIGFKVVAILFALVVAAAVLDPWLFQLPFYLAFGWFGFVRENLAALQPNPRLLAEATLCLLALGVGGHYFCRWLYGAMAPNATVAWRARWTAMGLGFLFLLFAAGIGTIGLTHQAAWLIGAKEPFVQDAFTGRARVAEAILHASPLRTQVAEEFARTGRLPDALDAEPVSISHRSIVSGATLGEGSVITISIKPEFNGGGTITLTPSVTDGKLEWTCRSTLPNRTLPGMCRQ